jgi:citrate/tricarballylate utilization protein
VSSSGPATELAAEADRQLTICNACRYCEDYCAVFPALELRTMLLDGDIGYLANLCHDCRACHQACMYTEPHEFALNLPKLLTEVRLESYERHSRPRWLRRAFDSGPLALAGVTLGVVLLLVALTAVLGSLESLVRPHRGPGAFYEVVSHEAMAVPALLLSGFGFVVGGLGLLSFWREGGGRVRELLDARAWRAALADVARMRWLAGSGDDCYYPDAEVPSPTRRWMHQLVMYGFLAAFGATVAAFIQEWAFGIVPPYGWVSVPVLLGVGGGVASVAGTLGMLWMKIGAARHLTVQVAVVADVSFIVSLLVVSATGLALLGLRETSLMGVALLVHLAAVAVLYVTAPYGKFVHAIYRLGALVRYHREQMP